MQTKESRIREGSKILKTVKFRRSSVDRANAISTGVLIILVMVTLIAIMYKQIFLN